MSKISREELLEIMNNREVPYEYRELARDLIAQRMITCNHGFPPGAHTQGKIGCVECRGRDMWSWNEADVMEVYGSHHHSHFFDNTSRQVESLSPSVSERAAVSLTGEPVMNKAAFDLISDIDTYRGRVSDELINKLIVEVKRMATRADWFLSQAIEEMKDRAASRDTDGERSMKRCVDAFNAMFGKDLTEVQGWQFMEMLKIARSYGGNFRADDFTDAAAYAALAGEAASGE